MGTTRRRAHVRRTSSGKAAWVREHTLKIGVARDLVQMVEAALKLKGKASTKSILEVLAAEIGKRFKLSAGEAITITRFSLAAYAIAKGFKTKEQVKEYLNSVEEPKE